MLEVTELFHGTLKWDFHFSHAVLVHPFASIFTLYFGLWQGRLRQNTFHAVLCSLLCYRTCVCAIARQNIFLSLTLAKVLHLIFLRRKSPDFG